MVRENIAYYSPKKSSTCKQSSSFLNNVQVSEINDNILFRLFISGTSYIIVMVWRLECSHEIVVTLSSDLDEFDYMIYFIPVENQVVLIHFFIPRYSKLYFFTQRILR